MHSTTRGNPACLYLGLEDDADTSLAFPSVWNTCHRGRRIVFPSLEHQSEHCLNENHRNCVAFLTEQATLPQHLRASPNRVRMPRTHPYQSFAFALIGIVVLVGLLQVMLILRHTLPALTQIPSPATTTLTTPAVTQTVALSPTPASTVTAMPKSTVTGEAVLIHRLEQPIGGDYKFVIHRVLYGESLNQFAAKYNTSIEAIMLVNYDLKTPVWVDALVIIPVGFTDVSSLPAFEAYEVTRAGTSLKVLALGFGVSLKDLKYYNAISTDESLLVGDWLLMPRPRLTP